ncbi:transcriptional regulator, XRE family [Catenulispora acidiphila DSM 44928]|uniref:Transcriptional regulator, XRE family n=1 Tax=Catenulispora acidiphila (strain DSM 44928 / JCM 14897 / NBRC 102108 / NRRL B-24433 / ID139908) TaxID=479433 RepID=C7Q3I7_CATAD|nr:helix-turn-helix domain-containing protein [Catenulispora acidiphila]ACU75752.1 transcriptional regulator, XRE family [Catenulispora acidiphila DSM 44928]
MSDGTAISGKREIGPESISTRAEFGRALTELREAAGLTIRDAAKGLGLPSSTIGGYLTGRHLPPVRFPDLLPDFLRMCGVSDPSEIEEWVRALWRIRRASGQRATAGSQSPYRGLAGFQPEHAAWFYGRESLTDLLIGRILADEPPDGPVLVVGASGSGKSSLIRAGLIPALTGGAFSDDEHDAWKVVLLTPGDRPLTALAQSLTNLSATSGADTVAALRTDPGTCRGLARAVTDELDGPGLVIVVDQFEEVFTSCSDESEREAFIAALCSAARNHSVDDEGAIPAAAGRVQVVVGLRADFYPQVLRHSQLATALQEAQIVVAPMSREDLRRAIIEPARSAGVAFEPGLVELILTEIAPPGADPSVIAHDSGALPLLGHALLATWERRRHGLLTADEYRATGGIHGAVARSAEDVFTRLSPAQQSLARQLFLRLVHVADQVADTRRRVARHDLLPGSPDTEIDAEGLQPVLDAFVENRLITSSRDTVEIAHEALLVAWPRLRAWIDADRAGLRVHRQLGDAAAAWRDADRDPHMLYRGVALAAAKEWADDLTHRLDLYPLELDFLDRAVRAEQAERQARRRSTLRLRRLVATLTVLVAVAGLLAGYAFQQRNVAAKQQAEATRQRDSAISRQVAIEASKVRSTDVTLAEQLAIAAFRISPTPDARGALLDSWSTPAATRVFTKASVVQSVAVTSDARTMATSGAGGLVQLWGLTDPGRPKPLVDLPTGHTYTMFSLAFSPDGRTLAVGGAQGVIRVWNTTDPARPVALPPPLTGTTATVYSLAFSPDGRLLVAAGSDGSVRLWNMADPSRPEAIGPPLVSFGKSAQAVAFSPNGRVLAAGSRDGTVRLWQVTGPTSPTELGGPLTDTAHVVYSLAFGPDGQTLAVGSSDGVVQLWNLNDPTRPTTSGQPLTGPGSWVNSLVFSPDGTRLAAADSDDQVWLWDAGTRQLVTKLPHPAAVTSVFYLRDNSTLATGDIDGIARLWRLPGPTIEPIPGTIYSTVMGPHHTLAVGSTATASLWDLSTPRTPKLRGPAITSPTGKAAFSGTVQTSPDGNTIAIGSNDGTVRLWDITDPRHPILLPAVLNGLSTPVETIAFSPDGHIITVGADEATIHLWNITDLRNPIALPSITGPTNYVFSLAFSPNGRVLAAGSADYDVRLWDVSDPARAVSLGPALATHTNYVYAVVFSPNGRVLAASSADETVQLWDVTDPAKPVALGPALTGPNSGTYAAAFGSGGGLLAASTGEGTVWLWDVTDPRRPRFLETLAELNGPIFGADLDPESTILVAGSRTKNTIKIWNTDVNQTINDICATVGDPISIAEWNRYVPDTPYAPPCR